MASRLYRTIAPLLAAQLTAILAGCGATPGAVHLATVAAPAAAPAAVAVAPAKLAAPSVTQQPTVTTTASQSAPAIKATITPDAAPAVQPAARGLFDHDYDPSEFKAFDPNKEDPTTTAAINSEVKAESIGSGAASGLGSWGMIGLGAAAAVLGVPAIGYAFYTGLKGSGELEYPTDKSTFQKDPGQYGWAYEPDYFTTNDSNHFKLVGWYVPAEVPTTKAILVLHGHTSDKDTALKKYGVMLHHDYNLYLYDSRFHGQSEGKMTTLGYYERNDALQALQRLRDRGNTSIGVMGESMGGAVAIEAAAMDPTVKACWADCAFDSLYDAVEPRAAKRKYPFPGYVAFCVVETASIRAHARLSTADPINWVDKISPRPLYLVHGQADDDTTPENSEKLYNKAGEPKTIWRTPNTTHADSWETFPVEYNQKINDFFAASL